jgi:outer membrane receptor for ferrienterochelin and colicins
MCRLFKTPIVSLLLFLVLPSGICAAVQDNKEGKATRIQRTVVTATLEERGVSQVPSSVQVIDRAQIQEMGADTVTQALEEAVGLIMGTESGRVQQPSIRGTGSLRTLVLIDGRRLPPGYRGVSDINQIPTTMIERIEVVRGPTSALYGSDAVGGVVNVITVKPPRDKTLANADLKAGTNTSSGGDTMLPQFYAGSRLGPFRFVVGGSYRSRDGWDYDNEAPDDGDELEQKYVSGQGTIDINAKNSISFGGYYNNFEREGLRDIQNKLTQRDAQDDSNEVFLRYDGEFADRFKLMLQAYHGEYETDIDLDPKTTDPYFQTDEKYKLTQYEGRLSAKISSFATATVGAEYREDVRGSDNLSPEYETDNKAGFGQLDMTFFKRLNLVAGLRLDDHSEFGSEWSPRIAASFSINQYLRLKGGYGHSFRAPLPYELYVTSYKRRGKDTYLANSRLKPETSQSYEIGLQSNLDVAKGLDLELTYFYITIDDMIEAVRQSTTKKGATYKYENISEADSMGLEFSGNLRLPHGWSLGVGASYMDTENQETGEQLANQPKFKGNLNAQWHIRQFGLRMRASYTLYSGMEDGVGNSLDDYSLLDFWVGKDLAYNLQLYAGMKNILDERPDDYNIQPAFVYCGLKWSY